MATTTIDLSGIAGLAPRFYGDKPYTASRPNLRYLGTEGQMAEGIFNPMATLGYMSPANATTKAATGTTPFPLSTALLKPSGVAAGTDSIFFGDEATTGTTGKILELDTLVDTALAQTYEIPIVSSTFYYKAVDMIMYQLNGIRAIFWLSENTTSASFPGYLGMADSNFGSPDPDWGEAVHSLSVQRFDRNAFILADNGLLYILDGNSIHSLDGTPTGGTNGTVSENLLVFLGIRAGTIASNTKLRDGVDLRGRMWIGLHVEEGGNTRSDLSGKTFPQFVGVYVWDRRTSLASMQDFIPIRGAREFKSMHIFQGQPSCFTISTDGYTEFRVWNGNEFKVVQRLGKTAYPNFRRHSVYEGGDHIIWFGADGKVYFYGMFESGMNNALYMIGDMTAHVTGGQTYSTSGVLVAGNATETVTSGNEAAPLAFYVSFSDSGGSHLKKWYPFSTETVASVAQLGHSGDAFSLVKQLPTLATVRRIIIRCAPTTNTGSATIATVKYYFNQSATASITKTITKDQAARGYISHVINKPYINSIQVEIEWSTTETLGKDSFLPSTAVVDFDPMNAASPTVD